MYRSERSDEDVGERDSSDCLITVLVDLMCFCWGLGDFELTCETLSVIGTHGTAVFGTIGIGYIRLYCESASFPL